MVSALAGCKKESERYVVMTNGDSINSNFLISSGNVGQIHMGSTASSLDKIYGQENVKQLLSDTHVLSKDSTLYSSSYYVYDDSSRLLLIAYTEGEKGETSPEIRHIQIKDRRFRTISNIGLGSTVEQITRAYPTSNIIQDRERGTYIYIPSSDSYLPIDTLDIKSYDSRFIADIPTDSVNSNAIPIAYNVSWYSNNDSMLSAKFWQGLVREVITWAIVKLPALVIMTLIFVALLRLLRFSVKRIKEIAVRRAVADETNESLESVKRITTIAGIMRGVGTILLWVLFLLMFLSKIDINIAPILASAGILGLAVGFGAQELVRDFISGFFMLLEDQIRTGDMVIINGTEGKVEKIELRTVTLRDLSGVVHIFQNGKINTLSNMTKEWSATVLDIGVAYKEDIDYVMELMRKVGDEMLADPVHGQLMLSSVEVLGLDQFGDSAIVIKAVIRSRPMEQWHLKREYHRRLKILFDKEGIEIPFPHISIYTGEVTKPMPVKIEKTE